MTQTERYILRLLQLHEGDRALLRRSAGRKLDAGLPAFDLFTGLWWPLRQKSPRTPQRWCAWVVAKLYGSFPFPDSERSLPAAMGALEPREERERARFRGGFDLLLAAPADEILLEPHLSWCLRQIRARTPGDTGVDWGQLLDDLWEWGRAPGKIQQKWAAAYLQHTRQPEWETEHGTIK